jgi:3-oxoacyl-[acyl-carrier-protein] synthase II/nodulation protein E
MGASGAIELLATMIALQKGLLPCAGGVANPDNTLGLPCLLRENRTSNASFALSNSFAFGGLNAALALKRFS